MFVCFLFVCLLVFLCFFFFFFLFCLLLGFLFFVCFVLFCCFFLQSLAIVFVVASDFLCPVWRRNCIVTAVIRRKNVPVNQFCCGFFKAAYTRKWNEPRRGSPDRVKARRLQERMEVRKVGGRGGGGEGWGASMTEGGRRRAERLRKGVGVRQEGEFRGLKGAEQGAKTK